jgi:TonB family protein
MAEEEAKERTEPSRRRHERFDLKAPLDVTVLRSGIPDIVPGRTVDASEDGLAAMLAGELTPGETVGLQVQLPAMPDPLRTRARVKYQEKLRCGLEFLWLSNEEREALRDCAKGMNTNAVLHARPVAPAPAEKSKRDGAKVQSEKATKSFGSDDGNRQGGSRGTGDDPGRGSGDGAGQDPAGKKTGKSRAPWVIALIAVLVLASGGSIFWWRWNRGWEEIESGLRNNQTSAAEKPQAQVAAEVMQKLLIHRVEPVYPAEARHENLQGIIALDIVVGRDGSVTNMRALNGPDVLARAAMDALRWWKFEPYRVNGEPAVVETTVAVEFRP